MSWFFSFCSWWWAWRGTWAACWFFSFVFWRWTWTACTWKSCFVALLTARCSCFWGKSVSMFRMGCSCCASCKWWFAELARKFSFPYFRLSEQVVFPRQNQAVVPAQPSVHHFSSLISSSCFRVVMLLDLHTAIGAWKCLKIVWKKHHLDKNLEKSLFSQTQPTVLLTYPCFTVFECPTSGAFSFFLL